MLEMMQQHFLDSLGVEHIANVIKEIISNEIEADI